MHEYYLEGKYEQRQIIIAPIKTTERLRVRSEPLLGIVPGLATDVAMISGETVSIAI
jgi:hypothetical protein